MNKKGKFVLWPAYFDSKKTRGQGRRVNKSRSIPSPKVSEIKQAVEQTKFSYSLIMEAKYPKTPFLTSGVFLIKYPGKKNQAITKIADQLIKIRKKNF